MLEKLKELMRNHALKNDRSTVPTGIMPLKDVRSAITFIDVEETNFNDCKDAIMAFYRENGIKGSVFFFDFRDLTSSELLITSITMTVLKKDLNWYDKPSKANIFAMLGQKPDLFISLINSTDFPIHYMAACSEAKCKVGRVQLPGNVFDIVLEGTEGIPQLEVFGSIKELLSKIQ